MPSPLSPYHYADEAACVEALAASVKFPAAAQSRAADLITRTRNAKRKTGQLESFLRQYGLETEEGIALMTLAEALLRIPDAATADALIRDKMKAAEWFTQQEGSKDWLVKAAGFGLSLTRKTLDSALSKIGEPVIRRAMVEAMKILGRQFVLGRTIDEAVDHARGFQKRGCRFSYDMLGEGARTYEDAEKYLAHYVAAIEYVGTHPNPNGLRDGVSVKLSALHPRYEARQAAICVPAMTKILRDLALLAKEKNVALTVDAEEADRLDLSLEIIGAVIADPALGAWDGFGLAIQAYSKRCAALIDQLRIMAEKSGRKLQVRLVKGAYWDTEIKRAQIAGLADYPVFTRKINTDLSYLACAQKLLARRDIFYPMLATHNAATIAAVYELAGADKSGFEFQRLHGMGESLYDQALDDALAPVCIYAPCGTHEELLAYLVRRLLENGANSSFINKLMDPATPVETLTVDSVQTALAHPTKRHTGIALPKDIFAPRRNSCGLDLSDADTLQNLLHAMQKIDGTPYIAGPLINGTIQKSGTAQPIANPANRAQSVGEIYATVPAHLDAAFTAARDGQKIWGAIPAQERAAILERLADLYEANRAELMGLCIREAGKTIDDALAELREAVDFCRYYAAQGRVDFDEAGTRLPGPTGERNTLTLQPRGTFICISPWNFPLAIFTGQIAAALMAGNAVIAKPATPTPLIATRAVQLMLEAGVPPNAIALLPGSPEIGASVVAHKEVAGVAFTGSTAVAWKINRALAAKDAAIAPLIAETGGQNAMIVDSSALPEQVIGDVMLSAFGSAGQRCSALRVLYLQDDIADKMIEMLKGAMATRYVGDPMDPQTDIGPIIEDAARTRLTQHVEWLKTHGRFIAEISSPATAANGSFFAPVAYEIDSITQLTREIFGPVLHVVRYAAGDLDHVLAAINSTGYGLTLGVHSRIRATIDRVTSQIQAGNAYVNRSIIGAIVGAQPFGGQGLSGTGPKAGGPHYLHRFATEKVVSTDTARQGGNTDLLTLKDG